MARSLSDIAVRDEAKEVWPDARPQAWNNRRRIRWNTLRIFSGRERRRWSRIVRRSRKVNVGQAPSNNKPANRLRCGNIKATIWQNVSVKGPFFSTTFSRPFKDQSGEWRNGTSFGLNEIEALINVAREAKEWISAHALSIKLLRWEVSGLLGASFTMQPDSSKGEFPAVSNPVKF